MKGKFVGASAEAVSEITVCSGDMGDAREGAWGGCGDELESDPKRPGLTA